MPRDAVGLSPETKDRNQGDGALFCIRCGYRITQSDHAIRIDGQHEYVLFNPAGRLFRVLCFKEARGTTALGTPSGVFTWFRGYAWRIAVCGGCGAHLGWRYDGEGAPVTFFGLIAGLLTGTKKPG